MTYQNVIADIQQIVGGQAGVGDTVTSAVNIQGLRFNRCTKWARNHLHYFAVGPKGALWYMAYNPNGNLITFGQKSWDVVNGICTF